MKKGKKIVSNIFYYFLDFLVVTIFGYLFWIITGNLLNKYQYGILFTIVSLFYILFSITTLGLNEALIKFIPEFLKKKKLGEVKSIINFSVKVTLSFSAIISIFIYLFSDYISLLFYNSVELSLSLKAFTLILFTGSIMTIFKSILQGFQKFKEMFLADFIGQFIKILTAVVLILIGFQIIGGIFSWFFWFLSIMIIALFFIRSIKMKKAEQFNKRLFLRFGLLSVFSLLSFYLIIQGGIIVLSLLSSFESVSLLGVAYIFGQLITALPSVITTSIFPSLSELWVREKRKFNRLVSISIKSIFLTVLPFTIFLIFFSENIISLLYPESFLIASFLFPGMLSASFLLGLSTLLLITLYSAHKPQQRMFILFLGMVVNVTLLFILIPFFDAQGAVLAYLISQLIILGLSLFFVNKIVKFRFSKRNTLIILVNIILFLMLYFISLIPYPLLFIILIIFTIFFYIFLLFLFKVFSKKDLLLLDYIPNKFGFKKVKNIIIKLVNFFD